MTEPNCPFCGQKLESVLQLTGAGGLVTEAYVLCSKCGIRGERKLWQTIIDTKKKFNKATDLLEMLYGDYNLDWSVVDSDRVYDFLKQINQREVK